MRIELVAHTPDVEAMVAVSMLTTTSGAQPSTLHERLLANPVKVGEVVGRLEVQHGNVLEHNRLVWLVEATRDEALDVMLDTRFLTFTGLGGDRWLMSGNLRAVAEYASRKETEFTRRLVDSLREAAPTIHAFIRRGAG
ncbi:hypothetical protein A3K69_07155 [Candidatus Bathyarchaeota archaeon RBG_16_57_9]|nr:MAG: hypothetical protein A3K69_07155 [Candidatus Bathyarchaeota archaeon RBG_16_57_9]OGD53591.1 MAG: hypothetical protein A3K81_06340 [Candidatus Bathyarchaeota archaeon RBG_13_60_20]